MALVYTSMTTWPLKWFEKYHEVLRKKGVHYTFTEGHKTIPGQEKTNLLVEPIYEGYTVRFFYFAAKKEGETFVGIEWQDGSEYAARVIVHEGAVKTRSGTANPVDANERVNVGDIYTLSLRTDDQVYIQMYFNDKHLANYKLTTIEDKDDYELWESSGNHYILSMHFYDELGKDPSRHLGNELYLNHLVLPVGSYGTYAVTYVGTTEAVNVIAVQASSNRHFTFETNGRLNKDDLFYCIVRITAYGLDVSVSFDPDHKFEPAVDPVIWLRCYFEYGSIQNAHIVSPS